MANPAPTSPSKFARYRAKKKAEGKKLLRIWVPDLDAPGFKEQIAREMAELRKAPEQADTTAFLEAIEQEDGWPE